LMASHMVVFLSLAGEQHTQFTDYECIAWENHSIFIIGYWNHNTIHENCFFLQSHYEIWYSN
jgi:hypothetical protein